MSRTILRLDASSRYDGSYSRQIVTDVLDRIQSSRPADKVIVRDLAKGIELIDEGWIVANLILEADRNEAQTARLKSSNELVSELFEADTIVIGTPIYNFSLPAALKAWIDLVARARETFRYTESGPKGLLTGKRVILVITSGGTELGGQLDFASDYLRHVLGFIGLIDLEVVNATRLMFETDEKLKSVEKQIAELQPYSGQETER